jgi:hypothetical protein
VTEVITSLNNPNPRCNNCGGVCPTSLMDSIWLMIHHFPLKLCGGLIFSAHTCYFLLSALIWRRYSTRPSTLFLCIYIFSVHCHPLLTLFFA